MNKTYFLLPNKKLSNQLVLIYFIFFFYSVYYKAVFEQPLNSLPLWQKMNVFICTERNLKQHDKSTSSVFPINPLALFLYKNIKLHLAHLLKRLYMYYNICTRWHKCPGELCRPMLRAEGDITRQSFLHGHFPSYVIDV